MGELWDIYDLNRKKTGRTAERDVYDLKEGEYHIIVNALIMNSKNEILLSKRAPHKKNGLLWEFSGGSILKDETSLEGMLRELSEELGLKFAENEAVLLKELRRDKVPPDFKDIWLFRRDVNLDEITFPDGEAVDAKWVTIDEFMDMKNKKEIIKSIDFDIQDYEKAIKI